MAATGTSAALAITLRREMFPVCFSSSDIARTSFPRIAHSPDRLVPIVGEVERSILCHRNAHRPAPRVSLRRDEPRYEILVHSARMSVLQRHANHFVTSARRSIP